MAKCEVCLGRVEKTCGYDDQPMLNFCTEDYIEHLEGAHPDNVAAQKEAAALRKEVTKDRTK